MEKSDKIPIGYIFRPTNSEIVCYFLKNKILGQHLPADFIPTIDVYSKSPDQFPFCDFRHGRDNEWYFYTTRPNCKLATDDGYYSVSMEKNIFKDNRVVGFLRILTYYQGRPPKGRRTNWIIHEYRVNPDVIPVSELHNPIRAEVVFQMTNFVMCKVVLTEQRDSGFPVGGSGID
ncbi:putative NAC domain-containing protein [Melia azedarach]|uniref:NAC domain-containing protein n=1 Tax=Melia azedarach TaxID=155640 RepID=A0ACC1XQP8_MELAZ|nr:putative NAC domain-containing protein [Melia azedarach]